MADRQLSSAEQARVRVAAMVAAGNATLGEAFLSRVLDEASGLTDDAARIRYAIARTQEYLGAARPMNLSATPWEQLALARLGRGLAPWERLMISSALGGDSDSGGDGPANGARYDGISRSDAAFLDRMRGHAMRHGLGWAADRPEILRLGPEAIELFARTNFQRQSFERLKEAGFEGRDAVNIARYAERHGIDANETARRVARAPKLFGGDNNPEAQREWRDHFRSHFADPDNAHSRGWLRDNLRNMRERGTPEQREGATEMENTLKLRNEVRAELNTATITANTTVATIPVAQQQTDTGLDALNGPATATSKPAGQQPTLHVAGPR